MNASVNNVNTHNTAQQAVSQPTSAQENDVKITDVINQITSVLQKLMNQFSEKNAQQMALVFEQYVKYAHTQGESNEKIKIAEQRKALFGGLFGVALGLSSSVALYALGSSAAGLMAPGIADKATNSLATCSAASIELSGKDLAKTATLIQNGTSNFASDERKMLEDYNATCGLITSLYNIAADLNGRLNQVLHVQ